MENGNAFVEKLKVLGHDSKKQGQALDWMFYEEATRPFLAWFLSSEGARVDCILTDEELQEVANLKASGLYLSGDSLQKALDAAQGKTKGEAEEHEEKEEEDNDTLRESIIELQKEIEIENQRIRLSNNRRSLLQKTLQREQHHYSHIAKDGNHPFCGTGCNVLANCEKELQESTKEVVDAVEEFLKTVERVCELWKVVITGDSHNLAEAAEQIEDDEDSYGVPFLAQLDLENRVDKEKELDEKIRETIQLNSAKTAKLVKEDELEEITEMIQASSASAAGIEVQDRYQKLCKDLAILKHAFSVGEKRRVMLEIEETRARASLDAAKVWVIRESRKASVGNDDDLSLRKRKATEQIERVKALVRKHLETIPQLLAELEELSMTDVLQIDVDAKLKRQEKRRVVVDELESLALESLLRAILVRVELEVEMEEGKNARTLARACEKEVQDRIANSKTRTEIGSNTSYQSQKQVLEETWHSRLAEILGNVEIEEAQHKFQNSKEEIQDIDVQANLLVKEIEHSSKKLYKITSDRCGSATNLLHDKQNAVENSLTQLVKELEKVLAEKDTREKQDRADGLLGKEQKQMMLEFLIASRENSEERRNRVRQMMKILKDRVDSRTKK